MRRSHSKRKKATRCRKATPVADDDHDKIHRNPSIIVETVLYHTGCIEILRRPITKSRISAMSRKLPHSAQDRRVLTAGAPNCSSWREKGHLSIYWKLSRASGKGPC